MDLSSLTTRTRGPIVLFLGAGSGVADGLPSTDDLAVGVRDLLIEIGISGISQGLPSLPEFLKRPRGEGLTFLLRELWDRNSPSDFWLTFIYAALLSSAAKVVDTPNLGVNGVRSKFLEYLLSLEVPIYVLTTNWDTSLDIVIIKLAFGGWRNLTDHDYGLRPFAMDLSRKHSGDKQVYLLKLNGSPRWFMCHHCKRMSVIPVWPESDGPDLAALDGQPWTWGQWLVLRSWFSTRRSLRPSPEPLWSELGIAVICRGCGKWTERLMVLPMEGGVRNMLVESALSPVRGDENWAFNVYQNAAWAVSIAQEFFFIGYSLPTYDRAVRALLSLNLKNNHFVKRNDYSIHVVSRDAGDPVTRNNFESYFSGYQLSFSNDGAEAFLAAKLGG